MHLTLDYQISKKILISLLLQFLPHGYYIPNMLQEII